VIDDAQHADDGLLDFLDHLLATARAPVFVLAIARPELLARRPDLGGINLKAHSAGHHPEIVGRQGFEPRPAD
jgi:hypothetical protein